MSSTETQARHTPGPWRANVEGTRFRKGEREIAVVESEAFDAIDIVAVGHDESADPKANALLIAAAPELLEALQALHDLYARTWDRVDGALVMMGDGVEQFEAAHAKASAAIAKANK